MESERKLRRIHGGAENIHFLQEEESNQEKSIKNVQDKLRIAQKAAELIQEQDVIFIDAGTTNELLINELSSKHITVEIGRAHV